MPELNAKDRRDLLSLLDQLCKYEEATIECHRLNQGIAPAALARELPRSRRNWRRAQDLMIKLERPVGSEITSALERYKLAVKRGKRSTRGKATGGRKTAAQPGNKVDKLRGKLVRHA